MTPDEFAAAILGWHDFFLAAASASAALLGLLFVGVSINLSTIAADERQDLRTRAEQAFANLIYVLSVSLVLLVPDAEPHGVGAALILLAALGLVRVARALPLLGGGHRRDSLRSLVRRMIWTVAADLLLLWAGVAFYTAGDARLTVLVMAAIFILIVGAADVSWEMLVSVSGDARARR
jgi:hypothetical protein